MTKDEERVWAYLVVHPLDPAYVVAREAKVPLHLAQSCIDRIGTPRDVLAVTKTRTFRRAETSGPIQPEAPKPMRVQLLEEAAKLTAGDRNRDYGDPYEQHRRAAQIFNATSGLNLSASDIVRVLIAVKQSRRFKTPMHRDSFVDDMAYTGILYECLLAEAAEHEVETPKE